MDLQLFLLIALLAFVSEYIDSSLGMGYGTTLTPLLLMLGYAPLQVVPVVLLSEFATGLAAAGFHHTFRNVDFRWPSFDAKVAYVLAFCGAAGVVFAASLAVHLPSTILKLYIGLMVLGMGLLILFLRNHAHSFSWTRVIALGSLGAFNKGIGGGGYGPLITGGQILVGLNAKSAIAITSLAEGVVSFAGILTYLANLGKIDWTLGVALMTGALLSTPLAALTVQRVRLPQMRILVGCAAVILGLLTLLRVSAP